MVANVCWFIQSHRDPVQILRLLRAIRRGSDGPIVLRHDHDVTPLDPRPFLEVGNVELLPGSGRQHRGYYSGQIQPYLALLAWLETTGVRYDWLINLTAQDYPVTPIQEIESFLATTPRDGFMRWWNVLGPDSPWSRRKARARYWHRYRLLPARFTLVLRALRLLTRISPFHFYFDYGPAIGIRRFRVPYHDGLHCLGGRSWWTIRHAVASFVLDFVRQNPDFVRHYEGVITPEESMVQTILVNSSSFDLVNDDLRYIDYSAATRGGAPRTLTVADLPLLATGRYHFARKFDLGVDSEVLDRIDWELLGLSPP